MKTSRKGQCLVLSDICSMFNVTTQITICLATLTKKQETARPRGQKYYEEIVINCYEKSKPI